jgi:hypothetical protein
VKKEDLPQLTTRLGELAAYYDKKTPTSEALRIWFDCLEGINWPDVAAVLTDWPKHKRAFPLGDEVRKSAAGIASERLEQQSKRNNATAPDIASVLSSSPDSPNARAFKRMWQAWRSGKVSSPRDWCQKVVESEKADASLKRFAEQSLALMPKEKRVEHTAA